MHFHFTLLCNSQFTQQIIELFHVDIKKYDQLIFIGGGGGSRQVNISAIFWIN